jgi:hypothetical protein
MMQQELHSLLACSSGGKRRYHLWRKYTTNGRSVVRSKRVEIGLGDHCSSARVIVSISAAGARKGERDDQSDQNYGALHRVRAATSTRA